MYIVHTVDIYSIPFVESRYSLGYSWITVVTQAAVYEIGSSCSLPIVVYHDVQ